MNVVGKVGESCKISMSAINLEGNEINMVCYYDNGKVVSCA